MKQISHIIAYITLGAVAVVSVLLYICPFSLVSYTPAPRAAIDCEGSPSEMAQLSMSPTTGGCLGAHIATGESFIATMPKFLSILFAIVIALILIPKRYLGELIHTYSGLLMQMRYRYRRYNRLLGFLFEKKLRAWLVLQQRVVTAH